MQKKPPAPHPGKAPYPQPSPLPTKKPPSMKLRRGSATSSYLPGPMLATLLDLAPVVPFTGTGCCGFYGPDPSATLDKNNPIFSCIVVYNINSPKCQVFLKIRGWQREGARNGQREVEPADGGHGGQPVSTDLLHSRLLLGDDGLGVADARGRLCGKGPSAKRQPEDRYADKDQYTMKIKVRSEDKAMPPVAKKTRPPSFPLTGGKIFCNIMH